MRFFNKKMLTIFLLGLSSGLPFLMTGGTLKLWLAREGVEISTIGYFGWVGMAYSLKFLWAPILDRFALLKMGRRRSWILASQIGVAGSIFYMGTLNPHTDLSLLAVLAIACAFFSATQDIAVDAYRRDICEDSELSIGTTVGTYGHRAGMLFSGGVGVGLVNSSVYGLSWGQLYSVVAFVIAVATISTWLAPEPKVEIQKTSLAQSFIQPFREFFDRDGALFILLFIFLFKLGDALGGAMLNPFYVQMGFTNEQIGLVAKTIGIAASLLGIFIGGVLMLWLGVYRSLWFFGVLQALSTLGFALITVTGPQLWALGVTVIFEDISAGMGNAAFVSFIALVCNRRFTATQFAALASVATLGRNFFSGFSGDMVKFLGWQNFFAVCAMIAIPGLLMLIPIRRKAQQYLES